MTRRSSEYGVHAATRELTVHGGDDRVSSSASGGSLNVAPHRMRPSSLGTVGKRLARDRLGELADVPVTQLSSEQVQEWQSGLLRGRYGLSPSTVADTRVTLNQVLDCAVDHRLIAVNPAKRVKPPRVPKSHGRHLDAADAQRLVAACSGARYGAVVAMLFMQGWRVSEVLGLAWSDLDLDAKEPTATVRRAVVQVTGVGRVLGPPKSEGAEGRALPPAGRRRPPPCAAGGPGRRASRCGTGVADPRTTKASASTSCSRPKTAAWSPANTSTS